MNIYKSVENNTLCGKDLKNNRSINLHKGDFVTTYDLSNIIAYVLKEYIPNGYSRIYALEMAYRGDDVEIHEYFVNSNQLVYLDKSFVKPNGILWRIHEKVIANDTDDIIIS